MRPSPRTDRRQPSVSAGRREICYNLPAQCGAGGRQGVSGVLAAARPRKPPGNQRSSNWYQHGHDSQRKGSGHQRAPVREPSDGTASKSLTRLTNMSSWQVLPGARQRWGSGHQRAPVREPSDGTASQSPTSHAGRPPTDLRNCPRRPHPRRLVARSIRNPPDG